MVSCTQQSCNFRYIQVHTCMNIVYSMYIHVTHRYVHVYGKYVHVCIMYVLYLWIHSMKAVWNDSFHESGVEWLAYQMDNIWHA
jgi:hypothetical protein